MILYPNLTSLEDAVGPDMDLVVIASHPDHKIGQAAAFANGDGIVIASYIESYSEH